MKVLIIEDDVLLSTAIKTFFEIKNYDVETLDDGEEVFSLLACKYDLFIIDINVPNVDGLDILKYIRSFDISTPIIIITASLDIENLSLAFEYGCSDYLKKPFHFKELDARVHKLLKEDLDCIVFDDDFIYKSGGKKFLSNGEVLEFRKKEKRLLEILMENINTIVATDQIIDYVWEREVKEDYTLRQLVNSTRKKLPINIIKTHNGMGYEVRNMNTF